MAKGGRDGGSARGTGPLERPRGTGALPSPPVAATAALADPPPGWLAPAIAFGGLVGAGLLIFGLVWSQTGLDLPGAAYAPPRPPAVAEDAWPLYRDADRALRLPPAAERAARDRGAKAARAEKAHWPAHVDLRHGLLLAAAAKAGPPWAGALVAANPGPLAALVASRTRPGFRVAGADQLVPPDRWEDFEGLGALATAAMRVRAGEAPGRALAHASDGLALGTRLLAGGGPVDRFAGHAVLTAIGTAAARDWPRLARAADADLAEFGRVLDGLVPPGDGGAWLIARTLDQLWRDAPQLAEAWRRDAEREGDAFATIFARPLAAYGAPRARRLARGVLADAATQMLADRRRGVGTSPERFAPNPFRSQAWQLLQVLNADDDPSPSGVMRVAGFGAVSVVLHPEDWAAYMVAEALVARLPYPDALVFEGLARLDGLRLRAAIERHRRRAGAPPAKLEALVPAYLPALPRDPYAPRRPYRWAEGRLWSVGPDGKWAGGAADDLRLI